MKPPLVDTGHLLALELARDRNHPAARRHWRALLGALPPSVTANHEFDETVALFDGRGHRAEAVEVGDDLSDGLSARALQVDEPPFRACRRSGGAGTNGIRRPAASRSRSCACSVSAPTATLGRMARRAEPTFRPPATGLATRRSF